MPSTGTAIELEPQDTGVTMAEWNRRLLLLSGCVLAIAAGGYVDEAQAQVFRRGERVFERAWPDVEEQAPGPQRGESVFERARPDYDPLGVRAGSFLIFPQVQVGEEYNDNVFAVQNNEDDDFITVVSPGVRVESDWGRHELNVRTGALAGFYLDHQDENYVDNFVAADGRLDVVRETFIVGGLGWRHLHEDRGDPDDQQTKEPVEYDVYSANLGAVRELGRVSARLDGNVDRTSYQDAQAIGGGTVDEDDRDRFQYTLAGQVGYEYLPDTSAFVRVTGRWINYDELQDGVDRSSQSMGAVVGTQLNFTGKTSGEVFLGYQTRSYDDDAFDDVSSPAAGGNLLWNVTGLTSIRWFLEGRIQETTQRDASSYLALRTGGSVEHELLRNLLVGGGITVGRDDYEGDNRQDDVLIGTLTTRYLINRKFFAGAEFAHRTRTSDTNDEFSQNVILLRLGVHL